MPGPITLSPEIQADYDFLDNTFTSKDKEPEVEVGDAKQATFEPQVKIKRWINEANFSIRLMDTAPGEASISVDRDRMVWAKGDLEARFYAQGFGVDNGAFEFEIVLLAKPASNVISFSIQSKLLKFFYQPPLTQQEIDDGAVRPDKVVGSYAVFHATKENMHAGQADSDKYRAGKAFHIYRPRVTDALGAQVWAGLNIDEMAAELTITIDQAWLDAATYPVVIDPNFGFESIGASKETRNPDNMDGSIFTAPSDVSTANSITFYSEQAVQDGVAKGILVTHSDLNIVTNGVGDEVAQTTTASWNTSSFGTSPSLSASTVYALMWIHFHAIWAASLFYDSGDTDQNHWDSTNNYGTPEDPTGAAHEDKKYSIYCTYTAAGATFTRTVSGSQPAATGTLVRKEQALRAVSGSQPSAAGTLARKEQAKRTVVGSQPAATGILTRIEKALRTVTGNQPSATGTLARIFGRPRTVTGSQPAASGTLARQFIVVRTLTGNQPAASGTLTRIEKAVRTLAGNQPAAVGVLVRIEKALRTLTGSQPAGTGTLVRVEKALRTLTGVQPSATGTIVALLLGAPLFSPMAKDTGTISILGTVDASVSITDEDEKISIKTEDVTL